MSEESDTSQFQTNVRLADLTTIGLGGPANYFISCRSVDDIKSAVEFSRSKKIPLCVLGGGSNIIFPDAGYRGIVVKIDLLGTRFVEENNSVLVSVKAGEPWDDLVAVCASDGLEGLECLSGIPGYAGATPIQNVGAYGQEVQQTIETISALDRRTLREVKFTNHECDFGYRRSRFKTSDAGNFIITEVTFRLRKNTAPFIRYPELQKYLESKTDRHTLTAVRNAVLELRKKKSMVIDPADINSRSVGSFFMNPVLNEKEFHHFNELKAASGDTTEVPTFATDEGIKIPAAWLVEHSGFRKGYKYGRVGISSNHSLALVNLEGTTHELLTLARAIEETVLKKFGVRLQKEPVIVPDETSLNG
jgi:UDP-N-acetylmuramate dehydrogenase